MNAENESATQRPFRMKAPIENFYYDPDDQKNNDLRSTFKEDTLSNRDNGSFQAMPNP